MLEELYMDKEPKLEDQEKKDEENDDKQELRDNLPTDTDADTDFYWKGYN